MINKLTTIFFSVLLIIGIVLLSKKYIDEVYTDIAVLQKNNTQIQKITKMRITGYISHNQKTAIGEYTKAGGTAAVSPNCIYLLGEEVYIKDLGVYKVNDLTASWLDTKYDLCTLDIAVGSTKQLNTIKKIGTTDVIYLNTESTK